jgi:hypothetical protein
MIKFILGIVGVLLVAIIVFVLRQYIVQRIKTPLTEPFDWKKFWFGMLDFGDGVGWAKDINSLLNIRKLTIYALIAGALIGYGQWSAKKNQKPVFTAFDYKTGITFLADYDVRGFRKVANSNTIEWIDKRGKRLGDIRVKDSPELTKALKPYGFSFIPNGILGAGLGVDGVDFEAGAGAALIYYYDWSIEPFLTNKGIYIGTSYRLQKVGMRHSSLGFGVGKGYDGDNRAIGYYKWEF